MLQVWIRFFTLYILLAYHTSLSLTSEINGTLSHPTSSPSGPIMVSNFRCRNSMYPAGSGYKRLTVPDQFVSWEVPWTPYNPPYLSVEQPHKRFIDPDITFNQFKPQWNQMDWGINRISLLGPYRIVDNYPLNPMGRTGLKGRGSLERWGPNLNVHVVFTRWKLNEVQGEPILDEIRGRPILQVLVFQSVGRENYCIPGKLAFPGETYNDTIKRVYYKGVTNFANADMINEEYKDAINLFLDTKGTVIYKGYVDDPLNTDNAWMETLVMQYNCGKKDPISWLPLRYRHNVNVGRWVDFRRSVHWISRQRDFTKFIFVPKYEYNHTNS